MKIWLFLSLLATLTPLTTNYTKSAINEEDLKRVYVYFSDLRISETLFNVEGEFYTSDGKKEIIDGEMIASNGLSKTNLDARIWFFDVNKKAKTCTFYIKDKNGELWSNTNLTMISGCVFDYSMSSYSTFNTDMGWHNISLEMDQFADYFVSRINTEKDTYTDGYMSYQNLNDSIFNSLKDYSEEKEAQIRWTDDFVGNTTFQQKWELIKLSYIAKYKPEEKIIWPYFVGAGLSLLTLYLGYVLVLKPWIRKKHERKVM